MWKSIILGLAGWAILCGSALAQSCTTYPYTLTNGSPADASEVMANFGCAALTSGPTLNTVTINGPFNINGGFTANNSPNAPYGVGFVLDATQAGTGGNKWAIYSGTNSDVIGDGWGVILNTSGFVPKLTVDTGGDLTMVGTIYDSDGAVHVASDERLKTNVSAIAGAEALMKINELMPVNFKWRNPTLHAADPSPAGFIAQQLATVFPEMVSKTRCSAADCSLLGGNGSSEYTVGITPKFDALLVAGIQELDKQVGILKTANDNQASEIKTLETRVSALERGRKVRTAQR